MALHGPVVEKTEDQAWHLYEILNEQIIEGLRLNRLREDRQLLLDATNDYKIPYDKYSVLSEENKKLYLQLSKTLLNSNRTKLVDVPAEEYTHLFNAIVAGDYQASNRLVELGQVVIRKAIRTFATRLIANGKIEFDATKGSHLFNDLECIGNMVINTCVRFFLVLKNDITLVHSINPGEATKDCFRPRAWIFKKKKNRMEDVKEYLQRNVLLEFRKHVTAFSGLANRTTKTDPITGEKTKRQLYVGGGLTTDDKSNRKQFKRNYENTADGVSENFYRHDNTDDNIDAGLKWISLIPCHLKRTKNIRRQDYNQKLRIRAVGYRLIDCCKSDSIQAEVLLRVIDWADEEMKRIGYKWRTAKKQKDQLRDAAYKKIAIHIPYEKIGEQLAALSERLTKDQVRYAVDQIREKFQNGRVIERPKAKKQVKVLLALSRKRLRQSLQQAIAV